MIDILGAQLNLSAIVDGVLGGWTHHIHCNWCNFSNLTILSFHSNVGTQVINTTTANNSAFLLPVIDGPLAGCRKQVHFVQVQLNLNFSSLVTVGVQGITVLQVEYYIKLQLDLCDMQNGNGGAYRLTTFFPNNLRTITAADFAPDILTTTLQDGPINLLRPDLNLTSAKTDSTAIKAKINSRIIVLRHHLSSTIYSTSYALGTPRGLMPPLTTSGRHRRTQIATPSSHLCATNTQILAASHPFMDQEILLVSVCQAFLDGLDTPLTAGFHTHFPHYSKLQNCTITHQCKVLQEMLQSALRPEMEYNNIRAIASKVNGFGGQAFPAQAHASQAEKTITSYSGGSKMAFM